MFLKISYRMISLVIGLVLLFGLASPVSTLVAQDAGGRISYGDSVEGTISDKTTQPEWVFRGTAGDVISIQLGPENGLVAGIILKDELDVEVVMVGDSNGNPYHLDNFVLPMTGVYRIVLGGVYNTQPGDYKLSLRLVDHKADIPKFSDKAGPIAYNSEVVGRLSEDKLHDREINEGKMGNGDLWTFSGKRGDVVAVTVTAVNSRAPFMLLTADGAVLSQGNTYYPVTGFELPITGDYIINVSGDFNSLEPKIYYYLSLQLLSQNGDDGLKPAEGGSIEANKLVLGVLNEHNNFTGTWTFDGKSGDVISIQMHRLSLEGIYMNLYAAGGDNNPLQKDWGGDENTFIIKNFKVPSSATYNIVVDIGLYGATPSVTQLAFSAYYYDVFVTSSLGNAAISHGGTLEYGTTNAGEITDTNLQDKWTFQGSSGDQVTITMKHLNGNLVADFEVFGPDGKSVGVANAAEDRSNAELVDFKLSSSGTYTVVTRPFSGDERGTYTITVIKTN